jgi:hypothetical protein
MKIPNMMAAVAVLAGLLSTTSPGLFASSPVQQFLMSEFRLKGGEWRDVSQRQPVSRSLDTLDGREVATLGVIAARVPPEFYVDQSRDIVHFKRGEAVLQIGRFSTPAQLADVALQLERSDIDDLRNCKPRSCDVQLSDDALGVLTAARFTREVPWRTPAETDAANRLFGEILVDLVNQYRARGDAALMVYQDKREPLSLAEEFRAMIASPPRILERFISVTHMAIAALPNHLPVAFGVASKQIYGTPQSRGGCGDHKEVQN